MKWLLLLAMPAPEQWLKGRLEHLLNRPVERWEVMLYQKARAVSSALSWAMRDYPRRPGSRTELLGRAPLRMLNLRDAEGRTIWLGSERSPIRVRWNGKSAWVEVYFRGEVYRFPEKNWKKEQPIGEAAKLHRAYLARRDRFAPSERDREVFYYCLYLNSVISDFEREEVEGVKGREFRSVAEVEGLYPVWDLSIFRNPYTGKAPRLVGLKERAPGEVTLLSVRGRRGKEMLDTMVALCWNGERKPVDPMVLLFGYEGLPEEAEKWKTELVEWLEEYVEQQTRKKAAGLKEAGVEGVEEKDWEAMWRRRLGSLYPARRQELIEAYRVLFTVRSLLDLYGLWTGKMPRSWREVRADFPMALNWEALGRVFGEPVRLVDGPSEEVGSLWLGTEDVAGTRMWTLYLQAPRGVVLSIWIRGRSLGGNGRVPVEGRPLRGILYDEGDWVASLPWEDRAWYFTCVQLLRLPDEHAFASRVFSFYYPPFVAEVMPVEWETPEELIYESFFIGEVLRNPYTGEDLRASLTREPAPRAIVWRALEVQPKGRWWRFGCLDGEGALLNVATAGLSLAREGVPIRLPRTYPRNLFGYRLLKDEGLLRP